MSACQYRYRFNPLLQQKYDPRHWCLGSLTFDQNAKRKRKKEHRMFFICGSKNIESLVNEFLLQLYWIIINKFWKLIQLLSLHLTALFCISHINESTPYPLWRKSKREKINKSRIMGKSCVQLVPWSWCPDGKE